MATVDENIRKGITDVGINFRDVRNTLKANIGFTYQTAEQLKNVVAENGDSNPEIVAARTSYDGTTYKTIGERADEEAISFEAQVSTKAEQTYVDTALSSIADGSPKEVFYSYSALVAKYPKGAAGPMLVYDSAVSDGAHSYFWNGTAWQDLGVYQGLEIPDESVTTSTIVEEAVTPEKINKRLYNPTVYKITGKKDIPLQNTATEPFYLVFTYDRSNIADGTNIVDINIEYDFKLISSISNVKDVKLRLFAADGEGSSITGYTYITSNRGLLSSVSNDVQTGYVDLPDVNIGTGKYFKVFLQALLVDGTLVTSFEVPYIRVTLNGTDLDMLGPYHFNNGSASTITTELNDTRSFSAKKIDQTYAKQTSVNELAESINEIGGSFAKNHWFGKKGVVEGDSISAGLYWDGSAYVLAEKPWHQHLKEQLGLAEVQRYTHSGTHISGAYTAADGKEANAFTKRFASMNDDADLIIIFGGTNDHEHADTAQFGTMSDREDISFYGALHVLMSGLIEKYLGKTIVFMTPLHKDGEFTPNPITGKTLKEYVNAIKEVAEFYGIHIVDTYSMGGMPTVIPEVKSTYINDGLHPNEAGHEFLGKRLAPIFEGLK